VGRQPWTSRLTVEECAALNIVEFRLSGLLDAAPGTRGSISWQTDSDDSQSGTLQFEIWVNLTGRRSIHIPPQPLKLEGASVRIPGQTIRLAVTYPHFGGDRFWFICECSMRAGRLYLPPGKRVFRCRDCYELTYRSSQEHNTQAQADREWLGCLQGILDERRIAGKLGDFR
jgi:hypothetical protein